VDNTKGRNRRTPRSTDGGELDPVFALVARYFGLLADPTRLTILHAICASEQSVNAIVDATGATQTNVSRHLGMLYRAGVVDRTRPVVIECKVGSSEGGREPSEDSHRS